MFVYRTLVSTLVIFCLLAGIACDHTPTSEDPQGGDQAGEMIQTSGETPGEILPQALFTLNDTLFETPLGQVPFPNDIYRSSEGLRLAGIPNQIGVLAELISEIESSTTGFGTTSGFYISFSKDIDEGLLPTDGGESLRDDSSLILVDIDPDSTERGRRWPIYWRYQSEETGYLPKHTLSVRLLEGIALRPNTTYALIVSERLASASETTRVILGDERPMSAPLDEAWTLYAPLRDWLSSLEGVGVPSIAVASVFTTQDPVSELFKLRDFVHSLPAPTARDLESLGIQSGIVNYEILIGRYTAPRFQEGEIPYKNSGGGIVFENDEPVIQGEEDLRFSLSIPEGEMPEGGWPLVLYAHGTGGNYQSFYRGEISLSLAKKGLAVISIDQIHHGERDGGVCDTGDYSQCVSLLFFNFLVPKAGRDNVRQSAIDYVSLLRMVQGLEIPAERSEFGQTARFNPNKMMFMGHSQGGLNGSLFMAIEPQVLGGILSGAGSNIAISLEQKTKPFDVNQLLKLALSVPLDQSLDRWHPALALLQTFIEPGDCSNFARFWFHDPPEGYQAKSILMTIGMRDEYTPPDTNFALAVAGRVPLVEPISQPIPALEFLGINSAGIPPISANVGEGTATAGLTQYEREGHFIIFDLPSAKERYAKFLKELSERPPPKIY